MLKELLLLNTSTVISITLILLWVSILGSIGGKNQSCTDEKSLFAILVMIFLFIASVATQLIVLIW